ncbi:DM9 repeat-containing protein [Pseudobacteriovorax antillogorgiicola]|uniref:Uncharacterized protein n=1 Tax=Pseudobacteriovorax antillogorgiicola TaxID=1513793 RepID=A0A1Y6BHP9_9BACT|nr:DM9 repeat-containing protein [Pseudobacteriovorax antillogorgiicola]TCS56247.1 uncharacterized protein DUF3421 [Pseudobacteriovorax antillogorgiicola]SMF08048.1 Protein of unknown function [Pseudobacteriovorax antillogorgiicola]
MKYSLTFLCLLVSVLACKRSRILTDDIGENQELSSGANLEAQPIVDNAPNGESRITQLQIAVTGPGLTHFIYKIGPSDQTNCLLASGYNTRAISEGITDDISSLPDGPITLCIVVQKGDQWQDYGEATKLTWTKATGALESIQGLTSVITTQKISLFWEASSSSEGTLVVRSQQPIAWSPEDGQVYAPGETIEDVEILASGDILSYEDDGLTDNQSYYYAVYAYDIENRYAPPSLEAGIPSATPYTWISLSSGALTSGAVQGGTRFDGSRELYICRAILKDQSGTVITARHPGKFIPDLKGDPSAGRCYYAFGEGTVRADEFEILVLTRGTFEEAFQWQDFTVGDPLDPKVFVAGNEGADRDLFVCRFQNGVNNLFTPGKTFQGDPCHIDAIGAPNSLRQSASFQILLSK